MFVRPDRDVAITPRSMGTSSGIEQGQHKLLLDLKSEKCAKCAQRDRDTKTKLNIITKSMDFVDYIPKK